MAFEVNFALLYYKSGKQEKKVLHPYKFTNVSYWHECIKENKWKLEKEINFELQLEFEVKSSWT